MGWLPWARPEGSHAGVAGSMPERDPAEGSAKQRYEERHAKGQLPLPCCGELELGAAVAAPHMVRCTRVGSSATDYLTCWGAARLGDRHEHGRAKGPKSAVKEERADGTANLSPAK